MNIGCVFVMLLCGEKLVGIEGGIVYVVYMDFFMIGVRGGGG